MSDAHGGGGLPGSTFLSGLVHSVMGTGVHVTARYFIITFAILIGIFFIIDPQQSVYNFEMIVYLSPIWIPCVLYGPAFARRLQAKRVEFIYKQEYVLLEIRIPRDTLKTPLAMETFFSNIHIGSGETTWYKRFVQGQVRPWWSFEIVSLGGRIHFYIWTRKSFRRLIESSLYAQYPELEIIEAEDYSRITDPTAHNYDMWGCEYKKSKADPFPIKTYMEYNLTPGAKSEENVDPLAQMLELFGSLGPEEQFWFQIIIRQSKEEKYHPKKTKDGNPYTWRDEATDLIESLRFSLSLKGQYIDPVTGAVHETKIGQLTKGQTDTINSIEQNITKQGFDVGMRAIYLAPSEKYQSNMIGSMLNMFKPFNNETKNTLSVQVVWSAIFNDWPWEDRSGHHREHINHEVTRMYRQRAYYHLPYIGNWFVMSTEELATIFHIPNAGITTPTLPRIQSATAGAPANLPQ